MSRVRVGGKGDHRHLMRAVLAMHARGLVVGLNVPAITAAVFAQYVTKQPALPFSAIPVPTPALTPPLAPGIEWVPKGALSATKNDQGASVHYNDLESSYIDQHVQGVLDALLAF